MAKSEEIEHFKCVNCGKEITYIDDEGEVKSFTHFDISRSKKGFYLDGTSIEEDIEERNEKMLFYFCEECFVLILNESGTLGKLFFNKNAGKFLY